MADTKSASLAAQLAQSAFGGRMPREIQRGLQLLREKEDGVMYEDQYEALQKWVHQSLDM